MLPAIGLPPISATGHYSLIGASKSEWTSCVKLVDVPWLGRMELARDVPEGVTLADELEQRLSKASDPVLLFQLYCQWIPQQILLCLRFLSPPSVMCLPLLTSFRLVLDIPFAVAPRSYTLRSQSTSPSHTLPLSPPQSHLVYESRQGLRPLGGEEKLPILLSATRRRVRAKPYSTSYYLARTTSVDWNDARWDRTSIYFQRLGSCFPNR